MIWAADHGAFVIKSLFWFIAWMAISIYVLSKYVDIKDSYVISISAAWLYLAVFILVLYFYGKYSLKVWREHAEEIKEQYKAVDETIDREREEP